MWMIDEVYNRNRIVITSSLGAQGQRWMVVAAFWAQQHDNHKLFLVQPVRFLLADNHF